MVTLRRVHRTVGLLTLLAFLSSGAYMLFVAHPDSLADGPHLMFLSRHIYILGAALVHLALAAYVVPLSTPRARTAQRIASVLLTLSSLLLVTAFLVEPIAGRSRTLASTLGIYTLFAGALLHFLVASRRSPSP